MRDGRSKMSRMVQECITHDFGIRIEGEGPVSGERWESARAKVPPDRAQKRKHILDAAEKEHEVAALLAENAGTDGLRVGKALCSVSSAEPGTGRRAHCAPFFLT